ncbi:MAG: NTP transferase domain-containing protein, partial [Hyphomicrobiaceae bacterium]
MANSQRDLLVIVLAAGHGTRMRSAMPKVLHHVAGRSILGHVMAVATQTGASRTVVVTSPAQSDVSSEARKHNDAAIIAIQHEQLGTAHAVLAARTELESHAGPVVVLNGDVPLIRPETLKTVVQQLNAGDDIVVVGFDTPEPAAYGRLIRDGSGKLQEIVEHADADDAQRAVTLCNSGIIAFGSGRALPALDRISNDNAQGEYYLPDAVNIIRGDGGSAGVALADANDVLGINSRVQLAEAEAIYQVRRRREIMEGGVTMIAPDTVTLSFDTQIDRDVIVEPNVFFGPGVTVESGARIRAFSHLEQTHIGPDATIGPYARLRPGANLGAGTRVGNFVEIKAAEIEAGAKV